MSGWLRKCNVTCSSSKRQQFWSNFRGTNISDHEGLLGGPGSLLLSSSSLSEVTSALRLPSIFPSDSSSMTVLHFLERRNLFLFKLTIFHNIRLWCNCSVIVTTMQFEATRHLNENVLTVCYYQVTYEFQSPHSILCVNVKELLAQSRRHIWSLIEKRCSLNRDFV